MKIYYIPDLNNLPIKNQKNYTDEQFDVDV